MHRHRPAWPSIRPSCSTSRSVATAAKAKLRPAENSKSHEPSDLKGWTFPLNSQSRKAPFLTDNGRLLGKLPASQKYETASNPSSRAPESLGGPSRSSLPNLSKWARPSPSNSSPGLANTKFPLFPSMSEQPKSTKPSSAPGKLDFGLSNTRRDVSREESGRQRSHMPRQFGLRPGIREKQLLGESQKNSASFTPQQQSDTQPDSTHAESLKSEFLVSPDSRTSVTRETAVESDAQHLARSERHHRAAHEERGSYKGRGSLLTRTFRNKQDEPVASVPKLKMKKAKKEIEKKVVADVYIPSTLSVGTLARLLGVRLETLQHKMRLVGMAAEAKYDHVLTSDYAALLADEFGRNPVINDEAAFDIYPPPPCSDPSLLRSCPPVVTIMGHVDHGKTTLLDNLRSSSVAQGEAGGITQHIGAFSVPVPSLNTASGLRSITFLDTPGHAAFSAMRARGARVTDIIVLVVAADDGIMPQTREVINLVKKEEANIGVVVAINKVDKPEADVDAVQKALLAQNMHLEALGGDIPSVEVSGLTGHGLPTLIETLSAMAEMQELRAEQEGPIQGYILESKITKGLGPVATVLVLRGCLKPGVHLISGLSHAKVRIISDPTATSLRAAYPGMAVTVSGWKTLPNAGDEVLQGSEADVKKALANRQRKAEIEATLLDVEAINSTRRQEHERRESELELSENIEESLHTHTQQGPRELRLIIKGDVSGSAEAIQGALEGIGNNKAVTRIISSGVGDIAESDVMIAKAVGGTIVGFSVKTPRAIETLAAQNEVPIISSNIIYRLMEIVKDRVISLLPAVIETRVVGEAAVLQLFEVHIKGKQTKKVAGCRVTNGLVEKSKFARLVRNGTVIYEGMLDTMRVLKKDVTEIRKGSECGLCFGTSFSDIQEGDLIQMYEKIEKPGSL